MTGDVDNDPCGASATPAARADGPPPATATEHRLAALWAQVLGVAAERIHRTDNFFEIGGTSRAAARLVIALDKQLSVGEFARTPTLAHLADLLDHRTAAPTPATPGT
jgi:hypothetical protein